MPRRRKSLISDSQFLAVAHHLALLSRRECGIIADEHKRYRRQSSLGQWRCSDVAKQLGLLTHETVEVVLHKQAELRETGVGLEDPLGGFSRKLRAERRFPIPLRTMITIAGTLLLLVVIFAAKGDLDKIANILSIAGFTGSIILSLAPAVFHLPFTITGWLRWISIPVGLSIALFLWMRARVLTAQIVGQTLIPASADVSSFISYMRVGTIVLAGLLILSTIAGAWRHWQLHNNDIRSGLLRQLVFKVYDYMAKIDSSPRGTVDIHQQVGKTLSRAAKLIAVNPYHNIGNRFTQLLRRGPFGVTSIWYLEPNPDDEQNFSIRIFAAPGAPEKSEGVFRKIKEEHKPIAFDREGWSALRKRASKETQGGGSIREKLLRMDRSRFISVTGYVYATGKTLMSDCADKCPAFDRGYSEFIPRESDFTRKDRAWLDFQSFIALPVKRVCGGEERPFGVVIALKNARNGITRDDWSIMSSTAKLLGLLLTNYELKSKEDASGIGTEFACQNN